MARKREPRRQKQTQPAGAKVEQQAGYAQMRTQLSHLGLALREIPGDGNCLFRALADQLTGCAGDHKIHRRETVDFIVRHRDDFEPFVEDDVPFDRHVACLEDEGTYAGNDSIVAFARNHGVTIVIHQLGTPLWQIAGDPEVPDAPQLHIAYHDGEHYNSVRKFGDLAQGPANVYVDLEAASAQHRLTAEEREVMRRSRCPDIQSVRQALNDCAGDVDAAAEFLRALGDWGHAADAGAADGAAPLGISKAAAVSCAAKLRKEKSGSQSPSERRQRVDGRERRRQRRSRGAAGSADSSGSPPAAAARLAALTI